MAILNKLEQFLPKDGVDGFIKLYLYKETLFITLDCYEEKRCGLGHGYVEMKAQETDKLSEVLRAMIRGEKYEGAVSTEKVNFAKLAGVSDFDFRTEVKIVCLEILTGDDTYVIVGPENNVYQVGSQKTKIDDAKFGEKVMYAFKFTYASASN